MESFTPLKGGLDVENQPQQEGAKGKQYGFALAVCLGAFTAGAILSWTSPALPMLKLGGNGTDGNNATAILGKPIDETEGGLIGSLVAIGALIGAIPTGILCEKIGRRWTIMSLGIPFILSYVLIVVAQNVPTLYAARIFAGIGTGGACVAIPMYIGEIAEKSVRGTLGSFFQLMLTVGILFSYVVGSIVDYYWLGILSGVVPVLFVIAVFFLPETPAYLIQKGDKTAAQISLQRLRGPSYNTQYELAALQNEVDEASRNKGSFKDLVSSKANINALVVGLLLMLFQQLSGVNAVIFYAGDIFKQAGSTLSADLCSIIVGVVQVIATGAAAVLVDRAGRRILLLLSAVVMCTCLIILGVYFHLKTQDPESVLSIGWLPLLSVTLFIITFSLGFGPLPWMMMSEIFAAPIKSTAATLAVMLNWTLTFIVTKTFGDLVLAAGPAATFWIFSGITAVGVLFVWFRVPETKGKSLAEIQQVLGGGR